MANPTLAELRTAVQARGFAAGTPGVDDAINTAVREFLAARRWTWRTKNASLSAATGAATVALSGISDLLHVDSVRIDNGTDSYELDWMPAQDLEEQQNLDRANDVPSYWTVRGNQLLLYPRPSKTFTLTVDYTPDVTDLVNPADVCVVPRIYMDAVVWGAVATLAYRQRDFALADRAEKKRDDAVLRAVRGYGMEQRQGGRTVIQTGIWDDMA